MIEINVREHGKIGILDLNGALDRDGVQVLKETFQTVRKKGAMIVILNCSGVTTVLSSQLQFLLTPIRTLVSIKGQVVLCCMKENIHKIFKTAMFYSIVKVYQTEEEAIEALTE